MIKVFFKLKLIVLFLCFSQWCEAEVRLPKLVSDGMVLQRDQKGMIWGFADPGETVCVNFMKKSYRVQADSDGNWKVSLPVMKAGGPYTMTINDIQIKDIWIGDVWLCSGQSNMELPVGRVTDMFRKEIETYSNPMIRHIKVPMNYNFHQPLNDIAATSWKTLTPENAMSFSAVAYFFAKEMYDRNKVPVGLINSSLGGSPVEAWISEEGLKPFPKYLSEREMYLSDQWIADVRKAEQESRSRWNEVLYKRDNGLHDSLKWYETDYSDADWTTVGLFDASWNNNGLNPVNGSHWFRKTFDVPAEWEGQDAVLRLGCIVDADSVYVNGKFVGSVPYQYPPRIYPVSGSLLKKGKNTITVRLISYGGRPHFVKEKPYKLLFANGEVSLEGEWKYKQGIEMPALAGETFFQWKPVGLYNAMIAPLVNYPVKGAVWYQGESNTGRYNEYYGLLTAMIADWRKAWENPELPFVIVELAGFGYPSDTFLQDQWGTFRAIQRKVAEDTPHAAIAPALDLGEWNDIHPLNKKEVGRRVAMEMENLIGKNK